MNDSQMANAVIQHLKTKARRGNINSIQTLARLRSSSRFLRNKIGPMTKREMNYLVNHNVSVLNRITNTAPTHMIFKALAQIAGNVSGQYGKYTYNNNTKGYYNNGGAITRRNMINNLRTYRRMKNNN